MLTRVLDPENEHDCAWLILHILENALRIYWVWAALKAWSMKRVLATILWVTMPRSWIASSQQSERVLSMSLEAWQCQWVESWQGRSASRGPKHGGGSRIWLSTFFGISSALRAWRRLHKIWPENHRFLVDM